MDLGKKNTLVMVQKCDFGVYLADHAKAEEKVLLPQKWVPSDLEMGDPIEVFLYRDSSDRPLATTMEPLITLGGIAELKVAAVTRIGAFLDWGLEKELLLPFREQTKQVQEGERILAALYLDKSERLCATMKLYPYLSLRTPYQIGEEVTGRVYESSRNFGVFVAVDDKYCALIPRREIAGREPAVGSRITARISRIHEDGKMDLDLRRKAYLQMGEDSETLMTILRENNGFLPIHDKSSPEEIRQRTGMSKNEFKRAVGHLYRERRIVLLPDGIKVGN